MLFQYNLNKYGVSSIANKIWHTFRFEGKRFYPNVSTIFWHKISWTVAPNKQCSMTTTCGIYQRWNTFIIRDTSNIIACCIYIRSLCARWCVYGKYLYHWQVDKYWHKCWVMTRYWICIYFICSTTKHCADIRSIHITNDRHLYQTMI